jgi:hypothetical protein
METHVLYFHTPPVFEITEDMGEEPFTNQVAACVDFEKSLAKEVL